MPHEIHVQECQGSPMSQISGTTGLDPLPFMRKNGQSMMSSKLPPLLQPRYQIGEESVFSHSTENESMNSLFQKDEYVFRPKRFFGGKRESTTFTIEKKSNSLCREVDADFKRGEKFNFINYILGSVKFQRMFSEVLSIVAKNPEGAFTKEQVHCAFLLVQLKFATYFGASASRIASQDYVDDIFAYVGSINDGCIRKNEFTVVIALFTSKLIIRSMKHVAVVIFIVPFIAQYIQTAVFDIGKVCLAVFHSVDSNGLIQEQLGIISENFVELFVPRFMQHLVSYTSNMIQDLWESIALAMVSCILCTFAIPWILSRQDSSMNKPS